MNASTHSAAPAKRSPLVGFVVTVLLTSFVAATYGFGFYLFSQIVTDMRLELGFGFTAVGTITAAGQLGFLVFALLGTWLSTRIGGGWMTLGSAVLCGLCLVLVPVTDDIVVIGVLLTILGGTAASVYVPLVEIVGRIINYEHRGKVLGLISSGTSYGVFINSMLVPSFVSDDNWRGLWYAVGSGTLMVTAVATFTFWRIGILSGTADESTVDSGGDRAESARAGWKMVLVRWVVIVWIMKFLNGFASMPFQNYFSPYLREDLGFDIGFASTAWGVIGVVGMVSGFAVGWLSDKIGVRAALVLCYSCFFVAAVILVVAPVGFLPIASGVLFGLAFYPIYGLVPAYVAKTASGAAATIIFGVTNVTQGVGGIAGNYLAGALKNLTGGFMWYYVVIAVTTVVLGFLTLQLPREGSVSDTAEPARPDVPEADPAPVPRPITEVVR
ncbi:MFS transporter [Saccharopolyspora sp. NPDC047091]|uniref:MFS transporter n=1 Tax=Saccharopolyspora sp. NPDC047091 TaxID=3155924 RepID=UPI0033D9831C